MPSININYLDQLKEDYTKYPNFIETGTYFGETIFAAEPYFENLYTIELSKELHQSTSLKYTGSKITFIQGDSSLKLLELLPNIEGRSIFYLDGHYSGGVTAKGKKDCPLYEELELIMKLHQDNCIVIIDDARLFEKKEFADWSEINQEKILDITEARTSSFNFLPSELHHEDRMVLYLNEAR
jgi:hypothetical protein